MSINLTGWTREDPPYPLRYKNGFVYRHETGSVSCECYIRPMHPDDMIKYGFSHPDAKHPPREEMIIIQTDPVQYLGCLTDGYQQVGSCGKYLKDLVPPSRGGSERIQIASSSRRGRLKASLRRMGDTHDFEESCSAIIFSP